MRQDWIFHFSVIGLCLLLASCVPAAPAAPLIETVRTPSRSAPQPPARTASTLPPTSDTGPASAAPTSTPAQTPTSISTSTSTAAPAQIAIPDGLRFACVREGNLYLRDGSSPFRQLTAHGDDRDPFFSEDGEKIVFYRSQPQKIDELYAISADGRNELALVTAERLASLGQGYDEETGVLNALFLPGTHRLLINTAQFTFNHASQPSGAHQARFALFQPGPLRETPRSKAQIVTRFNNDLLIIDTDTGQIQVLLAPGKAGGFKISPDGKLIALVKSGHVDIISINGQMVRSSLVKYQPTEPLEYFPSLHWLPDTSGLMVTIAVDPHYDFDGPVTEGLWFYPLDGRPPEPIPLDPAIRGTMFFSPDGNWLLYEYLDHSVPTYGVYLGSREGNSSLLASEDSVNGQIFWSSDSRHYLLNGLQDIYQGSVDEPPAWIDRGAILGWIDESRYLYYPRPNKGSLVLADIYGASTTIQIDASGKSIYGNLGLAAVLVEENEK